MLGSAVFRTGIAPGGALAGPWVRDPLWTRARAVPSLDLRFADNKSLVDAVTGQNLVTFTRASSGTFVGSDKVIKTAATNEARFDHNPTTGESLGLLVEEARTNVLLNSATLSTQSVTVAAAANTLSFYGTGTVTLTGVSTAGPLVGTGANNRVSLTFTPTVGVLILTVSGSVTNAQLEAGAFPTSYIPTTTTTATRAADVASITGTNFSSWYRQDEGTYYGSFLTPYVAPVTAGQTLFSVNDGTANNRNLLAKRANADVSTRWSSNKTGGIDTAFINIGTWTANPLQAAVVYKENDYAGSLSGATVGTDATVNLATNLNVIELGANVSAAYLNGTIRRLTYWPTRLSNATLQQVTQ